MNGNGKKKTFCSGFYNETGVCMSNQKADQQELEDSSINKSINHQLIVTALLAAMLL